MMPFTTGVDILQLREAVSHMFFLTVTQGFL